MAGRTKQHDVSDVVLAALTPEYDVVRLDGFGPAGSASPVVKIADQELDILPLLFVALI